MVDGVSLTGVWSRAAKGRRPGNRARTTSTAARRSTTSTPPATVSTWRWAASSRSSGSGSWRVSGWRGSCPSMSEAALDPHLSERGTLVDVDGATSPVPAPRLSRTPFALREPDPAAAVLRRWRVSSPDGSGRGEGNRDAEQSRRGAFRGRAVHDRGTVGVAGDGPRLRDARGPRDRQRARPRRGGDPPGAATEDGGSRLLREKATNDALQIHGGSGRGVNGPHPRTS